MIIHLPFKAGEQNPAYDLLSSFFVSLLKNSESLIFKAESLLFNLMSSSTNSRLPNERVNQLLTLLKSLGLDTSQDTVDLSNDSDQLHILHEALTHTSAQRAKNYERLEFLGDAVLRLAASEFIDRKFPELEVGERSSLRAQLVSDKWLAQIGKQFNIKDFLIIGANAAKDNSASSTLEAEATEALIGALYECVKSLDIIHKWLTPFWIETSEKVLQNPEKYNSKSALQEWSQGRGLNRPTYLIEERNKKHGNSRRFFCQVQLEGNELGQGWGGSRREAEQQAAYFALEKLNQSQKETSKKTIS